MNACPAELNFASHLAALNAPRAAKLAYIDDTRQLTYGELAERVAHELDIEITRHVWTVPELERQLAAAPDDGMRKYRAVFAQGRSVAWEPARTFNAQRGIAVHGLTQWIRENRPALRQAAGAQGA